MKIDRLLWRGLAVCAVLAGVTSPAMAQTVACPPGYGYSYGYGCVPAGPAYGAIYGVPPAYRYAPPVYDAFGLGYGYGPERRGYRYRHFDHGHDRHYGHDDHRGHR